MERYTDRRESEIDDLSPEDDDYEERLLETAKRFRHFDAALDAFLLQHGYDGELSDAGQKEAFIKDAFRKAGMTPPREIRKWYDPNPRRITRETAFEICFAFGLDAKETDDFFRRVFMRERSFDCHVIEEAVYYFCMCRGIPYAGAREIVRRVPAAPAGQAGAEREVLYTSSIRRVLDQIESAEQLIAYLTEKGAQFAYNNATAYAMIKRLWSEIAGAGGLLEREQGLLEDELKGVVNKAGGFNVENALLAILQLDRNSVNRLPGDRSLKPLLSLLPEDIQASFPDRQGLETILRGERVHYERVRKWLILLKFYHFWAVRALARGNYAAQRLEEFKCRDEIDLFLTGAGYMELYPGNPYDWLFLFAAHQEDPLDVFRELWNSLMVRAQPHP